MDQILAGLGLKLQDISDGRRIENLDQDEILADLRDADVPAQQRAWLSLNHLTDFDRVLMASDRHTNRCKGLLLVKRGITDEAPFLFVEALTGAPPARGDALLQRMVAYLLLRMIALNEPPGAILIRTRNPSLCRTLHAVAHRVPAAVFYPEPEGVVIPLPTAAFAHHLARCAGAELRFEATRSVLRDGPPAFYVEGPLLAVLDLRRGDEIELEESARQLFRARVSRADLRQAAAQVRPTFQIATR